LTYQGFHSDSTSISHLQVSICFVIDTTGKYTIILLHVSVILYFFLISFLSLLTYQGCHSDSTSKSHLQVSICFVIDTTGSMESHIDGVKSQITEIVKELQEKGCQVMGVAFVGYKDWCDGEEHCEVLPFSTPEVFQTYVATVKASGGGDIPEDVLGGLERAARLDWPKLSGSRLIFHIGDAPPHGRRFYDGAGDSLPNGHPKDIKPEDLFSIMESKQIKYYFGEMNNSCDQMKTVFGAILGSDPTALCYNVANVASIAGSVTASALRVVSESAMVRGAKVAPPRRYRLVRERPNIKTLPEVPAFSLSFEMPESASFFKSNKPMALVRKPTSIRIAPHPFASGACRLAYHGSSVFRSKGSQALSSENDVVFKEFITLPLDPKLDVARYFSDQETQVVASKMAFDFSEAVAERAVPSPFKIKYLKATMVKFQDAASGQERYMSMEKLFHGEVEMVKYTNNLKFVSAGQGSDPQWARKIEFLLAFSHFTWEHSEHYLIVTDLQGIASKSAADDREILLTDPAVHCPSVCRFGATNLREAGVNSFLTSHVCNSVCKALGLPKPVPVSVRRSTVASNVSKFANLTASETLSGAGGSSTPACSQS
jgi:hypothetical protein